MSNYWTKGLKIISNIFYTAKKQNIIEPKTLILADFLKFGEFSEKFFQIDLVPNHLIKDYELLKKFVSQKSVYAFVLQKN